MRYLWLSLSSFLTSLSVLSCVLHSGGVCTLDVKRIIIRLLLVFGIPIAYTLLFVDMALADEVEQTSVVTYDDSQLVQLLTDQKTESKESNKVLSEISGKLDTVDDVKNSVDNVDSKLKGIDGKIDSLILEQSEPEPEPVKKLQATKGKITYSVYGNANPTSQFASYAKQIIPKVGWNDDYIFLQDTSSSYVLVYGDLDLYSAGTVTGTGCNYVRWYYSGTGTGYLMQSGSSDVDISLNGYVVLSSLGSYPLIDDGFTLFRQEVAFYAVVAVLLFCLSNIWGFTLRSRG